MELHRDYGLVLVLDTFDCIVVSVCKPHLETCFSEALWVYPISVVLARHINLAVALVDTWLVLTPVAEFQLVSVGATRKRKYLVPEADAKRWS